MRRVMAIPLSNALSKPLGLMVFSISVFAGYFVLIPTQVLQHGHIALASAFVISFALLAAFTAATIKERLSSAKQSANSMVGFLGMAAGVTALQVCGLGVPTCGMGALTGIMALVIPGAFFSFANSYSHYIIAASIALQLGTLISMGAFKTNEKILK